MRRAILVFAMTSVLAGLTVVGTVGIARTAEPAQAQTTECSAGNVCLYGDTNYMGKMASTNKATDCGTEDPSFRSVKNKSTNLILNMYTQKGCQGTATTIDPGAEKPDVPTPASIRVTQR